MTRWSCSGSGCSTARRSAGSCTTSCGGAATLRRTTSGCGRRSWLTARSGWPSTTLPPCADGAHSGPRVLRRRRFQRPEGWWRRRRPPRWPQPRSCWRRRPRCWRVPLLWWGGPSCTAGRRCRTGSRGLGPGKVVRVSRAAGFSHAVRYARGSRRGGGHLALGRPLARPGACGRRWVLL